MLDLCKLAFFLLFDFKWKKNNFWKTKQNKQKKINQKKKASILNWNSNSSSNAKTTSIKEKKININTSHIVLINLTLQMNAIKFHFIEIGKIGFLDKNSRKK